MANKKITDLQLRSSVTADLNFPTDDTLQTYRVTAQQVKDFVLPDGAISAPKLNASAITGQTYDTEPALLDSILTYDTSAAALRKTTFADLTSLMKAKNLLDNAEFRFFQRQNPGTLLNRNNSSIGPDRWNLLTSGSVIAAARVAEIFGTSPSQQIGQFRQKDATAQRIGTVQLLEAEDSIGLRGRKVTFSFWARTDGVEVPIIRAAILEWTGAVNVPTRNPVTTWGATPTLGTNWTIKNTPTDLALTGSMQKFTVTATLGTTFNHLAVMVWTPNTVAQDADLYLGQTSLVDYTESIPFVSLRRSYDDDLRRCQRFYEKSYQPDMAPESLTTVDSHQWNGNGRPGRPGTTAYYKVTKRVVPTAGQAYNPNTGATATPVYDSNTNTSFPMNGSLGLGMTSVQILAGGTPAIDAVLYLHWVVDAELGV